MKSRATQIPQVEWGPLFRRISRDLTGRRVEVEYDQAARHVHSAEPPLPFLGLELEAVGAAACVEVKTGARRGRHIDHLIVGPKRVWMSQSADGRCDSLGIEAKDGSTLTLEFAGVGQHTCGCGARAETKAEHGRAATG